MSDLREHWRKVAELLEQAAGRLPAQLRVIKGTMRPSRQLYREFIRENELELALDVLIDLGDAEELGVEFWGPLRDAAILMGLGEQEHYAGKKVREANNP